MSAPKNHSDVEKMPAVGPLIVVFAFVLAVIVGARLWSTHDTTVEPSHTPGSTSAEPFYPTAPSWALIDGSGVGQ